MASLGDEPYAAALTVDGAGGLHVVAYLPDWGADPGVCDAESVMMSASPATLVYVSPSGGSSTVATDVCFPGSPWDIRTTYRFLSIAAEPDGSAHVVYTPQLKSYSSTGGWGVMDRTMSELWYATNETGSWVKTLAQGPSDLTSDAGLGAAVAVDGAGLVAIAAFYAERVATSSLEYSHLRYLVRQPDGSFSHSIIVSDPDGYVGPDGPHFTGYEPELRFDAADRPHIAFTDQASSHAYGANEDYEGQIRHAFMDDGAWKVETVYRQTNTEEERIHFPTIAISDAEVALAGLEGGCTVDPVTTVFTLKEFRLAEVTVALAPPP